MNRLKKKKLKFLEKKILIGIYLSISVFLLIFKRPNTSQIENRNLEKFPDKPNIKSFLSGKFFRDLSIWFSDTVPFRDDILTISYKMRDLNGIETKIDMRKLELNENFNEEMIATISTASPSSMFLQLNKASLSNANIEDTKKQTEVLDNKNFSMEKGVIVFGDGDNTRAVDVFQGFRNGDEFYSYTLNLYKEKFPKLNIYSMIVPNSVAYYCPDELKKYSANQKKFIDNLNSLFVNVVKIPVYETLLEHMDEDIYLRTDHHWSPLGAYYAAKEFAKIAKVDFRDITTYDPFEINKFYGSYYRLTGIERLKNVYEKFIYYTPRNIIYKTEQFKYVVDEKGNPIAKTELKQTDFFQQYTGGTPRAYQVYMGGDNNTTHVKTEGINSGRNLLILKDSFGNPVPSYLFFSFDNIYVVDYRYFLDDLETFINSSRITDILFINNVQSAMRDKASKNYRKFIGINE